MRYAEHVACVGEMRNSCKIFVGKSQGKTSLWRHRCDDNMKMASVVMVWLNSIVSA